MLRHKTARAQTAGAFRCFGRIYGQQLLNVDDVGQGLAQGAVDTQIHAARCHKRMFPSPLRATGALPGVRDKQVDAGRQDWHSQIDSTQIRQPGGPLLHLLGSKQG